MTDNTKVSIVIPVYNAVNFLRKTVESVQAQTYTDWELLLVEDHSKDASFALMQQLAAEDSRIKIFKQPDDEGSAAQARNRGIREAQGRYIAFLDADDLWKPEKLEKELAFMKAQQAAFVFSGYEFGDEDAVGTGKVVHVPGVLPYRKALSRTVIFTSTVLFDMQKLTKEQVYMPLVKSEDTACWWQILRSGINACGLDENLVTYRRPKNSLSSNKIEAIRRIWNLYRRCEKLSVIASLWYLAGWALRATLRRI